MSAVTFQAFLEHAFTSEQTAFIQKVTPLYTELENALRDARPGARSQEEVSFRFERLRLGLGIALMQVLTDLGGDEDSALVRDLLEDALEAKNVKEIDAIIQKKSHLFDELYTDLYVNPEASEVLTLFEDTLAAQSKEEADDILERALDIAQDLEFPSEPDDEEDAASEE